MYQCFIEARVREALADASDKATAEQNDPRMDLSAHAFASLRGDAGALQ